MPHCVRAVSRQAPRSPRDLTGGHGMRRRARDHRGPGASAQAKNCVRHLAGVKKVIDEMILKPSVRPLAVEHAVQNVLSRFRIRADPPGGTGALVATHQRPGATDRRDPARAHGPEVLRRTSRERAPAVPARLLPYRRVGLPGPRADHRHTPSTSPTSTCRRMADANRWTSV